MEIEIQKISKQANNTTKTGTVNSRIKEKEVGKKGDMLTEHWFSGSAGSFSGSMRYDMSVIDLPKIVQ